MYTGLGCILAAFTLVGENARPNEGSCEGCDWDPTCRRIRFRNLEWFVGLHWQTLQPQQGRSGEAPTRLFPTIVYPPSAIVTPFWKEYLFIRLSKRILLWSLLKLTRVLSANFRKFGIKNCHSCLVSKWLDDKGRCSSALHVLHDPLSVHTLYIWFIWTHPIYFFIYCGTKYTPASHALLNCLYSFSVEFSTLQFHRLLNLPVVKSLWTTECLVQWASKRQGAWTLLSRVDLHRLFVFLFLLLCQKSHWITGSCMLVYKVACIIVFIIYSVEP